MLYLLEQINLTYDMDWVYSLDMENNGEFNFDTTPENLNIHNNIEDFIIFGLEFPVDWNA